ncbi:MAG: hypothetical protein KKF16_03370 [Euryarchaeota archaeon]|nr:hypothetical protein [Euryarchaeota archaeon]MBU4606932.1 hypothetical protein [Euryarchaeota archaeon]MBV1729247.1 hypothetical protein [Methanobacterium sp.]MBV1755334.1 hypothetical protein [Methanobacterium sp.]
MKHTNPWNMWSRNTALPSLVIAFWSRLWLEWWAIIPITIAIFWTYVNPRIFSKAKTTNNWASKTVMGERVWSKINKIPVPYHHQMVPNILSTISGIGALFIIGGVYSLEIWPLMVGFSLVYYGKLWFLDRMVWLYEDMKYLPPYGNWLY